MVATNRNAPAGGTARGAGDEHGGALNGEYSSPGGLEVSDQAVRPEVEVEDGDLHKILDRIDEILGRSDPPVIFRKGTVLVAVIDTACRPQDQETNAPSSMVLTTAGLRDRLNRAIRFKKWDGRQKDTKDIDCPMPVAQAFRERGEYRHVPEVTALAEAPVLLPNGRIIEQGGYDRHTGIYLAGAPEQGFEVTRFGDPDPEDSLQYLRGVLEEFPFRTPADESAAIAALLTVLVSPGLTAVPLCAFNAESPGVGKSTGVRCIGITATGRHISALGWSRDEAEAEKRIHGAVLSGDPVLNIDNVESALFGQALCQLTSEPKISVRQLGGSALFTVPARVALYATGNNLVIKGDLTRRVIVCRLYSGVERPEQRTFKRDIVEYVRRHRQNVIRHLLAIPRAYLAAGSPDVKIPAFGSFEDWDRLVRRPLVWLGMEDPRAPAEEIRAEDPERQELRALLQAWHAHFGREPQTAAEVIRAATETYPRMDGSTADDAPELSEAVAGVCTTRNGPKMDARTLGFALRRYCDRIESGLRLEKAGTSRTNVIRWQVVEA